MTETKYSDFNTISALVKNTKTQLDTKINVFQGTENAGKMISINEAGNIAPTNIPKKLSEFENDLYYPEEMELLWTVTNEDCTSEYDSDIYYRKYYTDLPDSVKQLLLAEDEYDNIYCSYSYNGSEEAMLKDMIKQTYSEGRFSWDGCIPEISDQGSAYDVSLLPYDPYNRFMFNDERYAEGSTFSFTFYRVKTEKLIGEDLLPTTVPRIESAEAGQLIEIKEVDENGKPTVWAAIDKTHYEKIYDPFTSDVYSEFPTGITCIKDLSNWTMTSSLEHYIGYENMVNPDYQFECMAKTSFTLSSTGKFFSGYTVSMISSKMTKIDDTNYYWDVYSGNRIYIIIDIDTLTEDYASKFSERGIYMEVDENPKYVLSDFQFCMSNFGRLNRRYIPDTIARTADVSSPVRYIEQELTDEQKAQARTNIGAISEADVPTKLSDLEQVYLKNELLRSITSDEITASDNVYTYVSTEPLNIGELRGSRDYTLEITGATTLAGDPEIATVVVNLADLEETVGYVGRLFVQHEGTLPDFLGTITLEFGDNWNYVDGAAFDGISFRFTVSGWDYPYSFDVNIRKVSESDKIPEEYLPTADAALDETSTRPVQNQAVAKKFSQLSEEIVDYLPKNQGAENVGKILVVGTDGNLTLTDMPEGGVSGDVIGTLDESNNILLSGSLADGTYVLKYENTDGTYTEIGNLVVGKAGITNLADSTDASWVQNGRVGSDGTDRTDATGKDLTNYIPVTNGDVVRVKNFDIQTGFASGLYNASKGIVISQSLSLMTDYLTNINLSGEIETFTINHADVKFVRLCGISSLTDADVIITVNEEIV